MVHLPCWISSYLVLHHLGIPRQVHGSHWDFQVLRVSSHCSEVLLHVEEEILDLFSVTCSPIMPRLKHLSSCKFKASWCWHRLITHNSYNEIELWAQLPHFMPDWLVRTGAIVYNITDRPLQLVHWGFKCVNTPVSTKWARWASNVPSCMLKDTHSLDEGLYDAF